MFLLRGVVDALPDVTQLNVPFALRDADEFEPDQYFETAKEAHEFVADFVAAVSRLIMVPLRAIADSVTSLRYLGPLRETPSRDYVPPRFPDPARWGSGLGAWDRLNAADDNFVAIVNEWLSDENRLNSGYRLARQLYKELDLADPLTVSLLTGRAAHDWEDDARLKLEQLPTQSRLVLTAFGGNVVLQCQDVGIGISQVIPVLVTALDGEMRLLAIEQPELHLHPKLQAELADLLISSAMGETGHLLILETHSELIPLRIMRRIRESRNGVLPQHLPALKATDVGIYYVELYAGATVVRELELSEDGQLLDPWPEGFFEEGFRERFSN